MAALNKPLSYSNNSTCRLHDSIIDGEDVATIHAVILQGVDINARDPIGYTALIHACSKGRTEVVDLLVKSGADVNLKANDVRGDAPLHKASHNGILEMVKCLMDNGADVNITTNYGTTALKEASEQGHLEIVKCLLENGADVNINTDYGNTALQEASEQGHLEIVKCLVERGADIDTIEGSGNTAVLLAFANGHLEIGKYLVEKGANINARNKPTKKVLHIASADGYVEIVKILLEKGADINAKSFHGVTPVLRAAENSQKDVVDLLIHSGANIDIHHNVSKYTVLHYASASGWLDTVQYVIERNGNPNARDKYGCTALHDACESEEFDIARCLLQAGASWDIVDKKGRSPFNYVTREENPDFRLIKLFIENGAYLKRTDYEGIVKNSSSLRVLQDVELCCQAILNKFNYRDLPELYKLPVSRSLPSIEKMRMKDDSVRAESIKRTVEFQIQTKGHCNILAVRPEGLSLLSVSSILEHCEKKKTELSTRNIAKKRKLNCQPISNGLTAFGPGNEMPKLE